MIIMMLWLAHMLRLNILPEDYIYPKELHFVFDNGFDLLNFCGQKNLCSPC